MKITNRHGLPRVLQVALESHKHVRAEVDYTATELFKPALMLRLEADHKEELVQDVVDGLQAMYGTAIHAHLAAAVADLQALAAAAPPTLQAEQQVAAKVGRFTIGGTPDLYDSALKALYDYKFTSVYSTMFGEFDGAKKEWVGQLNCYAYCLRKSSKPVDSAAIVALYSDWRAAKARESHDYPQLRVEVVPVTLYPEDVVEKSLLARVEARDFAKAAKDVAEIPPCSPEERWEKPTTYAVYTKTNPSKATRVLNSIEEATSYVAEKRLKDSEIRLRQGASVRCESYCSVKQWCPHFQKGGK